MPQSIPSLVEPHVLKWARESAGVTVEEAARKASVDVDRYLGWEKPGGEHPTLAKLRSLADMFKRPLSILLLPDPPVEREPMTDYRRPPGDEPAPLSRQLRLQIRRAYERREHALALYRDIGEAPPQFQSVADLADDPDEVAKRIRQLVDVDLATQSGWPTRRKAFLAWRDAIEKVGIFVFQVSRVEAQEIDGFSIADRPLPVIAANRKHSESRRIFTLFHELTHVLLRAESLCDLSEDTGLPPERRRVEVFCNHVAGSVLVPEGALLASKVVVRHDRTPEWDDDDLEVLARQFNVSREAVLRRLLICRRTTNEFYRRWRRDHPPPDGGGGGPISPAVDALSILGPSYTRLVLRSFYEDRITVSDVSNQLRIKLQYLQELEERAFRQQRHA